MQILQTQPMLQVVDGQRTYIANAVNIAFAGDFSTEIPTSAQIQAGSHLIACCWELPQLTLSNVRGVSEFIPHSSPGDQWLRGRRGYTPAQWERRTACATSCWAQAATEESCSANCEKPSSKTRRYWCRWVTGAGQ